MQYRNVVNLMYYIFINKKFLLAKYSPCVLAKNLIDYYTNFNPDTKYKLIF